MASDFIVISKTEKKTAEAIIRFTEFSSFKIPQVVGAIDGVQIEVIGPSNDSKMDYFNRKQHYFIITQATIGVNLFFLASWQASQEAFTTLVSYDTQLCIKILSKRKY